MKTLQTFKSSSNWLRGNTFTDKDLDEAKLEVFADIDAPNSPGSKGLDTFQNRITDEMKQLRRDRIFSTTRSDLNEVAEKYLNAENPMVCVFGSDQNVGLVESDPSWNIEKV